ncbi:MAG: hypothetical protein ABI197_11605 [Granulicella sp.]
MKIIPRSRILFRIIAYTGSIAALGGLAFAGYYAYKSRVLPFPSFQHRSLPSPVQTERGLELRFPNENLIGIVGEFPDELTAYLRLQYLRSAKPLVGREILMTSSEDKTGPVFRLRVLLDNDLLGGAELLSQLQIEHYISHFEWDSPPRTTITEWEQQNQLFEEAYQQPVKERLLHLPPAQLHTAVAQFILFKGRTDPRIRRQLEPDLKAMSRDDSLAFAADMIAVAKFYDLPLDMLLGVGAMENNYLDVRGDLKHAVWKRRAQRGDIVLKRRGGRVLVSNYSIGPWQITRETLRYVHALYLKDKRNYSDLPERLQPPKKLDLDHVDGHVLTTYAGLLLRTLLDYFHGDVEKAVGAYNGGAGRPNLKYAQGVSIVADYAHRVLGMAAGRKGIAVQETPLTTVDLTADP